MITRADDYPIHQTAEPIAVAGGGQRNFYDRYFFNGYTRDGALFLAAAMGQYPNRGVADAAFNVVHRGRQYVVRASRRMGSERMESRVGPLRVEVLEPLRALRLVVEPNAYGLSADLVFTGRTAPIEEPRFHREHEGRVFMDSTRLTQHVEIAGQITLGGETIALSAERCWGSRDRSWGIRPIGERDPDAAGGPAQFFWLWAPVNFPDLCTHFDVNEGADGTRWHQFGTVTKPAEAIEVAARVDHALELQPGTRCARRATISLTRADGEVLPIEMTPLYNFQMVGVGYNHPTWGHGMVVGDDVVDGESFALADVDPSVPFNLHIQAVCEARLGSRTGIGVLEQLIIGPHAPSGLHDLFDVAE
ncbi:MAG: hypothetical protein ABI629_25480 [bacterium]